VGIRRKEVGWEEEGQAVGERDEAREG